MNYRMDSHEFNNILKNAQGELKDINDKMKTMTKDLNAKLSIIRSEEEWTRYMINLLLSTNKPLSRVILNTSEMGEFEKYGSTVTQKTYKEKTNVFNLKVLGNGEYFFRNDVEAKINNVDNLNGAMINNILKHDSIKDKEIVFDYFSENNKNLTLSIEIDNDNLLGSTKFNMIEIDSFLPGSFDIKEIKVIPFGFTEDKSINFSKVEKAGKLRITFHEKLELSRIDFLIELKHSVNYDDTNKYPFGIRHLYFYNCDFKKESYVISKITSNNYIKLIKNEINIMTDLGIINTTIEKEGIQLFLEKNNDELEYETFPSKPEEIREIPINTKEIWIKVPIKNSSLIFIDFDIINR